MASPWLQNTVPPALSHQPLALSRERHRRGSILKNVLILGVNGFIGHHLSKYILAHTDWHIYGMDLQSERVGTLLGRPAVSFRGRRYHHQSGMGGVSRAQVRCDPAAGGHRDAGDLCSRAAAGVRIGFRGQPAHHSPLREVQEARGVSLDLGGVRRQPRQGVRSGDLGAGA